MVGILQRLSVAAVILGVVGMGQPLWHAGFRLGFWTTLLGTVLFTIVSHFTETRTPSGGNVELPGTDKIG